MVTAVRKDLIRPSYRNGFARSADESERPQDWVGIARLWVPALGNVGATLRDLAGLHKDASQVDVPTWRIREGSPVTFTDGSNDAWDLGGSILLDNWTVTWLGIPRSVGNTGESDELFGTDDFGETDETSGRDRWAIKQSRNDTEAPQAEVRVNGTGDVSNNVAGIVQEGIDRGTITVGSGVSRFYQFPRLGCHRFSGSNNEFAIADHLLHSVYNRPLTASQVYELYKDPLGIVRQRRRVWGFPEQAVAAGIAILRRRIEGY